MQLDIIFAQNDKFCSKCSKSSEYSENGEMVEFDISARSSGRVEIPAEFVNL